MQKEEIKFKDSTVFEGMTSIRAILRGVDSGVNDRKIEKILFDKEKFKKISKELGYLKAISASYGYEIIESDGRELEKITLGSSHGGLVAITGERTLPFLSIDSKIENNGFYVMIEGIEDPYNFGYTLRSLYAAGVAGVILPERNWMSAAGVVARASAGAGELLPLYTASPEEACDLFHKAGYHILCAGIRDSVSVFDESFPYPILLVIGGEKRGISRAVLEKADQTVRIDYARAFQGSLSAASAATVMAFEIFRQNKNTRK